MSSRLETSATVSTGARDYFTRLVPQRWHVPSIILLTFMLSLRLSRSGALKHSKSVRWSTSESKENYKILVVGGGEFPSCPRFYISLKVTAGSGGLSVAHQIVNRFAKAGKPLNANDIAIVDAAEYHNYQASPGRNSHTL